MNEPQLPKEHIPALDGVRGVAALLVIFWHYVPSSALAEPETPLAYLSKLGGLCWAGVDLFFILSGFLIARNLLRNRTATNVLAVFYIRRICRIFPLYFLLIAFYGLVLLGGSWWVRDPSLIPYWTYLTFTQNFFMAASDSFGNYLVSPTWSLAVEEQFYLIIPFILVLLPRRLAVICLVGILPAATLYRLTLSPLAGYLLLPARADTLATGCLLAILWETPVAVAWLRRNFWLFPLVSAPLILGAAAYIKWGNALYTANDGIGRLTYPGLALACATLIAWILSWPQGRVAKAFSSPVLTRAGILSYALYLLHGPMLHIVVYAVTGDKPGFSTLSSLWLAVLCLVLTWLLSEFLHRSVERPILRIGHKYHYRTAPSS